MSKSLNKSYRIKTDVGINSSINVNLEQDYDVLNILSLKIDQKNAYKLHTSDYGVIAGRVLANEAFGIPNAKINIFIPRDKESDDVIERSLYPYNTFNSKNKDSIRFNLLPDSKVSDCHSVVGTFPSKRYVLDNDNILEIFEKYFKFTTRTNDAGDFMIFGIPVGMHDVHVDIDLSDIGILSQKPRDMVYKGYNITQFENPNKFKESNNLDTLPQIITQDISTNVIPFWGDLSEGEIGITRCDVNINYKFEPTCVFIGSVVSDNASNGITKRCTPTKNMGAMDEITTGSGTIEMIRKKPDDTVEEFQIQGTQLINGDGIWCYQIPMNLDYMMTDEYGNMVPTDNPTKGIPTRTKVRFRISLQDFETNNSNMIRGKMLVPNNPEYKDGKYEEPDYNFGSSTREDSYKDLFWNGVYSIKSFIPRFQKGENWKNSKYSGIKRCNYFNSNNPIPYNNIRIKLPLMYILLCAIIKVIIWFISIYNRFIQLGFWTIRRKKKFSCMYITGELCPELADSDEDWYFAPRCCVNGNNDIKGTGTDDKDDKDNVKNWALKQVENTRNDIFSNEIGKASGNQDIIEDEDDVPGTGGATDKMSIDFNNRESLHNVDSFILSTNIKSFIQCIEMNLADEYRVIQFEFYNDWINGMIYIPRWMRSIRKKQSYLFGLIKINGKIKACNEDSNFNKINYVQKCSIHYDKNNNQALNPIGCGGNDKLICHKGEAMDIYPIFGNNGGIINTTKTSKGQYVYYFKPCEIKYGKKVNLYATDIILLGTLNNCDKWGIPNSLSELRSSTYQMPQNNVLISNSIDNQQYYGSKYKYGRKIGKEYIRLDVDGMTPKDFEEGSYTEMAGIDWGIKGPLQNNQTKSNNKMFKPGGHFLGLSCRSSETSILSCVNLSRICEHGVWMSQRHEMQIPKDVSVNDGNKYVTYDTYNINPTGLISKDEISDTEYRSIFATLNHNGLKTIKDENGKLKYDFNYIYPTNFGGELKKYISDEYNRDSLKSSGSNSKTYYDEIRRTGEFTDEEYLKFRLGTKENFSDEKSRHFLINNDYFAIPVYENSFYFYFGLHDGATALDEFKKQYYAVCKKNDDLISAYNDSVIFSNKEIIPYQYCNISYGGAFSFNLEKCNDEIFPITIYCMDSNKNYITKNGNTTSNSSNATFTIDAKQKSNMITYQNLKVGEYTVIATNSKYKTKSESFIINNITYEGNVYSESFYKEFSKKYTFPEDAYNILQLSRKEYGGYISLSKNQIIDKEKKIDLFNEGRLKDYVNIKVEFNYENKNYSVLYGNGNKNIHKCDFYYNGIFEINDNGDYMLPVPKGEQEYTLYISFKKNGNCEIDNDGEIYSGFGKVGKSYVSMPSKVDFSLNEISYNKTLNKIKNFKWDNEEGDFKSLNNNEKWLVKKLVMKYEEKPLKISVDAKGGLFPQTYHYYGHYEDKHYDETIKLVELKGTDATLKRPFKEINIPSMNYVKSVNRHDFGLYVTDAFKGRCPEEDEGKNYFMFPVIFKPFFMESCILKNSDTNKSYIVGSVYNGIIYDYKEGFSNCYLNDTPIKNFINVNEKNNDFGKETNYIMNEFESKKLPKVVNENGEIINNNSFEFGNRKYVFGKEIEGSVYGLEKNEYKTVKLQLGSIVSNDELNDSCNTSAICYNASSYVVSFSNKGENIYANIEGTDKSGKRRIFAFTEDEKEKIYPFEDNKLILDNSEKLLNKINESIEKDEPNNNEIEIPLQETKNIFYAISSNNRDEDNFSASHFLNKFNVISITNFYSPSEIKNWFPMDLSYIFIEKDGKCLIDVKALNEKTTELIKNKEIDVLFYAKENDYVPLEHFRISVSEDGYIPRLDITSLRGILIDGRQEIYISQDIYDDTNTKQPFRYKKNILKTEITEDNKEDNYITFSKITYETENKEVVETGPDGKPVNKTEKVLKNIVINYTTDKKVESNIVCTISDENNYFNISKTIYKGYSNGKIVLPKEPDYWEEGASVKVKITPTEDDKYYYKVK